MEWNVDLESVSPRALKLLVFHVPGKIFTAHKVHHQLFHQ